MSRTIMKAIVVDDEPKNVKILRSLLDEFCPSVNVVGEAFNAQMAHSIITETRPDLVLLDIEMPYGNAFDLLDQLKPVEFEVIFITAFNEYSLKAFKYSALDYLLKPVNIEELITAVAKAEKRLEHKLINLQINNLFYNFSRQSNESPRMALTEKDGTLVFIELKEIIRVEARKGYTFVFVNSGKYYISSRPIKEYEELLPADTFFRVHNSFIINIFSIKKYHKGRGGVVELNDGTSIEVAARRKDEFLKKIGL